MEKILSKDSLSSLNEAMKIMAVFINKKNFTSGEQILVDLFGEENAGSKFMNIIISILDIINVEKMQKIFDLFEKLESTGNLISKMLSVSFDDYDGIEKKADEIFNSIENIDTDKTIKNNVYALLACDFKGLIDKFNELKIIKFDIEKFHETGLYQPSKTMLKSLSPMYLSLFKKDSKVINELFHIFEQIIFGMSADQYLKLRDKTVIKGGINVKELLSKLSSDEIKKNVFKILSYTIKIKTDMKILLAKKIIELREYGIAKISIVLNQIITVILIIFKIQEQILKKIDKNKYDEFCINLQKK